MYIDCHVHCRAARNGDKQDDKETIEHALAVAADSGITAVFDMPNTDPPVTTTEQTMDRLEAARACNSPVAYGLHIGVTSDEKKIEEAVKCHNDLFLDLRKSSVGVVGLKMFAGRSVGGLSVVEPENQRIVYRTLERLGYDGVLVVHCEDETIINAYASCWDPEKPWTHDDARPEQAETASVNAQIVNALRAGYACLGKKGRLHIAHCSTPIVVNTVQLAKQFLNISCGATFHHLLLNTDVMHKEGGIAFKVNPPLRSELFRKKLMNRFLEGMVDTLESDHAPHTRKEKFEKPYLSGIPWLARWPAAIAALKRMGASDSLLDACAYHNVCRLYRVNIPRRQCVPKEVSHVHEYAFDPLG